MIGKLCKWCGKKFREHTKKIYIPSYKRKHGEPNYKVIFVGKTYLLSYCCDEHFTKYKERLMVLRQEFNKKRDVFLEKNPKCIIQKCNKNTDDIHHILPLCYGGNNNHSNLAPLCILHHNMCHHKGKKINGIYTIFNPKIREYVLNFLKNYPNNVTHSKLKTKIKMHRGRKYVSYS